jgi:hypothetical protein
MICCHSAIERPYFFSMDGKYDAGPCFGQGGACSTVLMSSVLWLLPQDEPVARILSLGSPREVECRVGT